MADLIYFDIPKEPSEAGADLTLIENEFAVLEQVKNCVVFSKGSKLFKSKGFGLDLIHYLFEPIDIVTGHSILKEIERGITDQISRVRNLNVEVIPHEDDNLYEINIRFTVDESQRELELSTTLTQER